jgi:threonine synthase
LLSHFWREIPKSKIANATQTAYSTENFKTASISPLFKISGSEYTLELSHGPTGTFKDIPFQLLPFLFSDNAIVVAASAGSAGIAALKSFAKSADRKFILFFPLNGVTKKQKEVLLSYNNKNILTIGVDGSLPEIHAELDSIFTDKIYILRLIKQGINLVSINSLPNARVLPLIVPIIAAYCALVKYGVIKFGENINLEISSEHSTFIEAVRLAKELGLPLDESGKIKVIPSFFHPSPKADEAAVNNDNIHRDAICRLGGIRNFIDMIYTQS